MKRFRSINIQKELYRINEIIFENAEKAKSLNFGGFRESGFDKIKTSFFNFVFLCGGDGKTHNSRKVLTEILNRNENVKIIISEDLEKFKGNLDLLTFEIVLEAVSKMILITLESFGTACELGAFTRINIESNKVVTIIDNKHIKDKSFINFGPIHFLKEINKDRVFTASFSQSGGKHYLITNNQIETLSSHSLLTNQFKITKYYIKKENDDEQGRITNLNSFLISVLDYVCLVGFASVNMIMDFYSKLLNDKNFIIDSPVMKRNNEQINDIISSFLHILESIDFLYNHDDLFMVNSKVLAPQMKSGERWIGKVLFTNAFTRTDEYLLIKCHCEAIKNKVEKYGFN